MEQMSHFPCAYLCVIVPLFRRSMKRSLVILALAALLPCSTFASTDDHFLPLTISYVFPQGALSDDLAAKPALGFSLGYHYAATRQLRIGVCGTWTRMTLGTVGNDDLSDFAVTMYQMMANARWRFVKHGWTPWVEGQAGMTYLEADMLVSNVPRRIDGVSEVNPAVAGLVGIQIPVSEKLDVDVYGRYTWTFADDAIGTIGIHAGVVYALPTN